MSHVEMGMSRVDGRLVGLTHLDGDFGLSG
jgi:hypothetical protein